MLFIIPGNCLPRGLIDVTDCYYGFPIALSYPHFLDADEKVQNMTEGTHPNRTKHETYFMINRVSIQTVYTLHMSKIQDKVIMITIFITTQHNIDKAMILNYKHTQILNVIDIYFRSFVLHN